MRNTQLLSSSAMRLRHGGHPTSRCPSRPKAERQFPVMGLIESPHSIVYLFEPFGSTELGVVSIFRSFP